MSRGPSIKRTIQLLLLIFLPFLASGQDGEDRYPIRQEGRWGYMNAEGELVIEPRIKAAGPFREGRALVRKGGTYGYIDRYGDMLINARYSYAEPFKNGRGKVYRERRDDPFLIDREGEFVVDGPYESVVRSGAPGLVVVKTSS